MPVKYHSANCAHNARKDEFFKGTGIPFDVAGIYGANFVLKSKKYAAGNFTHVPCPAISKESSSKKDHWNSDAIVIAVDGACRRNGSEDAMSAYRVYFAKNSTHNGEYLIPYDGLQHSSQKAELHGCVEALRTVEKMSKVTPRSKKGTQGKSINQVIIKTDSDYLFRGVTKHLRKWKTNGIADSKGRPVVNRALFHEIDDYIQRSDTRDGIQILFWKVPREENRDADKLANKVLDEAEAEEDGTDDGGDDEVTIPDGTDDGTDDGGVIDDGTDDNGEWDDGTDDGY